MFLLAQNTHRMLIRYHPRIGQLWVADQRARIPHERGAYVVRTNSQGFRSDLEFRRERRGRPRILFFGDSITAGDGCHNHERFAELVGADFDAEVFNYGLSGSGTDQQLLIYEEFARDVEADLVVLAVPVHNIDRINAAFRPILDRITRRRLLVPKPYFTLSEGGELELHHVPVPLERPAEDSATLRVHRGDVHREANPRLRPVYRVADALMADPRLRRLGRFVSPQRVEDHTRLRAWLLRLSGFDPYPEYRDPGSDGQRLMSAIVERFLANVERCPVAIVPIPDKHYTLTGLEPFYQEFFERFSAPERGVHVLDITRPLQALPFAERKKLDFSTDPHFSPSGNRVVADSYVNRSEGFSDGELQDLETVPWGTMEITMDDCVHGTFSWNSNLPEFGSGEFPIQRLAYSRQIGCEEID